MSCYKIHLSARLERFQAPPRTPSSHIPMGVAAQTRDVKGPASHLPPTEAEEQLGHLLGQPVPSPSREGVCWGGQCPSPQRFQLWMPEVEPWRGARCPCECRGVSRLCVSAEQQPPDACLSRCPPGPLGNGGTVCLATTGETRSPAGGRRCPLGRAGSLVTPPPPRPAPQPAAELCFFSLCPAPHPAPCPR